MIEHGVTIPAGDVTLGATLTVPEGQAPFPAALLVAGSGPLDRDGNHPKLPLAVSKDLAQILAREGWATLRFDKRGIGESTGDYMSAGLTDEFADARMALAWLRDRPEVASVVAIGHSVGALSVAEMSAYEPDLLGAGLLAYTAQDGDTTLRWQAAQIAGTMPGWVRVALKMFFTTVEKQQSKAIKRLRKTTTDTARIQGQKVNARWMREFLDYDPEPILRLTKTPLLAITGSKDVQVNPEDVTIVAAVAGRRATTLIAPDVDHLLRHEDAETSNPNAYKRQIGKPIDPSVADALVAWVHELAPIDDEVRDDQIDGSGGVR